MAAKELRKPVPVPALTRLSGGSRKSDSNLGPGKLAMSWNERWNLGEKQLGGRLVSCVTSVR